MKKTFKTMLALMAGAMVFTACSNDDITENIPQQIPSALKPMTFTASMEGKAGATRAAIDGLDIKWTDGDKISIFDGATENNGNQEFTLTDGDGTTSGTFTGTAATATTYYALYPYVSSSETRVPTRSEAEAAAGSDAATYLDAWQEAINAGGFKAKSVQTDMNTWGIPAENQAIILAYLKNQSITIMSGPQRNASNQLENVVLPAAQTATAGSADPQAMLMIGTSTDATTLEFKNVCAYVKVKPTFACSSIVLKSNGTESLAGTMTLGLGTDGNPTTTVTNGTNTVTLSGTIAANGTYCIAVCPATLASGFTVEFKDASDKVLSSKSTAKSVTLTRNKILNLGTFDAAPSTTGKAKATIGGVETDVNWVQLWKDGPKFAEFNVGAANNKPEDYGGYYSGNKGRAVLDNAPVEWGDNWRTPTQDEYNALIENCVCDKTTVEGVSGYKYTGKGDYSGNSIFFPAAGKYYNGNYLDVGINCFYWSSTLASSTNVYSFKITADYPSVQSTGFSSTKLSVRAVLNETAN